MVEKIKAWLDVVHSALLWVVTPLAILAGVAYSLYVRSKAANMQRKLQAVQQEIGKAVDTANAAGKVATDEEEDYDRIRDEYKSSTGEPPKSP